MRILAPVVAFPATVTLSNDPLHASQRCHIVLQSQNRERFHVVGIRCDESLAVDLADPALEDLQLTHDILVRYQPQSETVVLCPLEVTIVTESGEQALVTIPVAMTQSPYLETRELSKVSEPR